jgi:hydrogenase maturation protein HypF
MCDKCGREYSNPLDRRYHAQPIACPDCGPRVSLRDARSGRALENGISGTAALIRQGRILAVKGLGGFHLVCDPLNTRAVARLRALKERKTKPLALMARDIETVEEYAFLNRAERREILSPSRPIVLLKKKKDIPGIAPHLDEMGFMLAYTPLHALLLRDLGLIVATSSNKKDAPIIKDEAEGIAELCDAFLTHDRPIEMRADDSVMKLAGDRPLILRRARGYVPYPQEVPEELASPVQILALGGELKDTVSVYKNGYVVTSQFLGDLDDYRNFRYFEETVGHLCRLFGVTPRIVVSDLHPDFRTTAFGRNSGLPHLQVQHHAAHILAALLEHRVPAGKKVLGVSFDGFGYGENGEAWGGEFLIADYTSWFRMAHFSEVALPGGDLASRQPWRMALSYLREAYGDDIPDVPSLRNVNRSRSRNVQAMMRDGLNSPLTSSCGRLFDAVSFLVGLSPLDIEYEAEAPLRLEAAAEDGIRSAYHFSFEGNGCPLRISFSPAVREIVKDITRSVPPEEISSKFHNTLAGLTAAIAEKARAEFGIDTVVLAGGVFLNKTLLVAAERRLEKKGFRALRPVLYSPNDESLSLGQIAFALGKNAGKKVARGR